MSDDLTAVAGALTEGAPAEATADPVGQTGEPVAPETDEAKNARIQAEAAAESATREKRRQASIQKRMDELTAEKYAARKQADDLMAMNRELLEAVKASAGGSRQQQGPTEPTREQFESYEDFVTARAEFRAVAKAEQAARAVIEQAQARQQETTKQTTAAEDAARVQREFMQRRAAVEKEIPDFREVVEAWEPDLPDSVADMISRLPDGPKLCYHFAKNPDLQAQFRETPAYMHGVLLGELRATLKSVKQTSAPAPGKPVATSSAPVADGEYTGDPEGYLAWARKHMK